MKLLIILSWFASGLIACTLVEGDRIVGHHLAAENPVFATVSATVDVGPAPVAGARRTLQHFELARLAKEHSVMLTGPDSREACFERATIRLERDTLRATLRGSLGAPDLEISDLSQNPLPLGTPSFRPEGLSPSGLWRGKWLYGENRSVPIWAQVYSPSRKIEQRASSRTPEISRGEMVRVEVYSRGILLAFDAAAESSGHVGEQVTLRNPATRQLFRAIVKGPEKVEIRK